MELWFHETVHILVSFLIGFICYKKIGNYIAFPIAFLGGVLIDLDHLIDYFLAFGFRFNFFHFLKGYQFLKNDKIYIFFHAWEWVILLFIIAWITKKKAKDKKKIQFFIVLIYTLAYGILSHFIIDTFTNRVVVQGYSIGYRIQKNFALKAIVTKDHYKRHLRLKSTVKFK